MGRLRQCFRFNQYCDGCVRETDQLTNVPDPDLPQTTIDLCDDCLESLAGYEPTYVALMPAGLILQEARAACQH